ncbi:tRNA adenosine deaminase-associated protein [Klenkia brasiliensis]|uniref:Putative tRNA adenosine deaminase-associated protein n=1 Tax=Klenkia brasiliensis TaxID=333142 RepID=A0A1G7MM90_9ACTN|nr:tRNA adenosine deaminase-associated protein [Klenkia brasiliensis]SDF62831.1 putative tRNA adenosine deaminase-associated protein [Klenkia brasiliensis]
MLTSFAVHVARSGTGWAARLLADDAASELPALEAALTGEWPGPFVFVVDSRLYFVALTTGPGGMVRAMISDGALPEFLLAAEVMERYGIEGVQVDADDESEHPAGDLDLFADAGLPRADLEQILLADLWADEMVAEIAGRLGFADELAAAVAP